MNMPDFEYHTPESLGEVCALLAELGDKAVVLAGGTDLVHKMKQWKLTPQHLVSLKHLDALREIRHVPGRGVVIGALVTQNGIYTSPLLQERYLSVSQAAHQMASNQIRNLGTIGGNIANAVPSADLPPILVALQATIRLVSAAGERTLPLEEFFVGSAQSVLARGEVLTEITIPDQRATGSTYIKFGLRRSGALAVAGSAVAVTVDGDTLVEARIALSSAAPTVLRARRAEEFLTGRTISDEVLARAGVLAGEESRPRDSIRGSAEYRRNLVEVLTKRALRKAIDEGHG
ncbi:MAG TPA: xanthine dehydrogenase family protein subunit M [Deferrisomatales bacterium]|nr:xanthine dehydrogenase family protein subunit M [Deferrisomatales bacterium]